MPSPNLRSMKQQSTSPTKGLVTISDWILAQGQGGGLGRLLTHVASWDSHDTAWISIATPELIRSQWKELDARKNRGDLLPLFGIPFAAKDNIDVAGFETTAACPDFAYLASQDARVISLLKSAGAIVIGKTNLDQFATGLVGTRSPYGIVPNSFDPRYVGGGSSSGSASVVARALVPFALGTDTAGSGRVPAGLNNIVGLKPTRGALSTRGVVPACRSLDCVSILSLNTEDAELVFQISSAYDEKDAFSRVASASNSPKPRALEPAPRIAICESPPWFGHTDHESAYNEALESCTRAGWNLVPTDFARLFELADLLYEGPWVAERFAAIKSFIERPDVKMDPVVYAIIHKAQNFSSVDVFEGEYLRRDLMRRIETQFASFDAILTPTTPTFPTLQDLVNEPVMENSRLGTYTNFVNFMDWSALFFPAGFRADGLPFGLTLISAQWEEQKLLHLSRQVLSLGPRRMGYTEVVRREIATQENSATPQTLLAVVGAHCKGLPLNHQLLDIGATFRSATLTAPRYRLYELNVAPGFETIRKPGLKRINNQDEPGFSIEVEVWNVPITETAKFIRSVSLPLSLGPVELDDKSWVTGFVCENVGPEIVSADISKYGGWKKFLEASSTQRVVAPLGSRLTKIVIANRGEIAVRIASTLKRLGIHSVAVYSRQDRGSRHVAVADSSFLLEGTTVSETYLAGKQIINIAKTSGAEAIIPGYGFLSENADFAEECEKEGIIWIGPTPRQMRTLGLKHLARELAQQSKVPLLPGSAIIQTVEAALKEADRIGYPLMVKSTAGGGGIGLQKCSTPAEIQTAFTTVSHQGKTYFNENGIFLEHFVENARHIEVQIIGNGQGDVKHLGLRDCSLQRRNQKVIEESPATFISAETSRQMCEAAIRLAKPLSYRNVGTVEFIYDSATGFFYFLEVNTRLQVEHSVTEAVSRIDLVEAMICVASNDSSSLFDSLSEIADAGLFGHAIEARIYAETPLQSFRPSTGTISELCFPGDARVDTWISIGTEITSLFDPLLAKVTVHGTDRNDAIKRLQSALRDTEISGVETNLAYLQEVAAWGLFENNAFTTNSLNIFEHSAAVFQVLDAGPLTTLQDYPGRLDVWHVGIPPSGPMDHYSFRLANKILGNAPDLAGLECTSVGPTLLFSCATTIAVTGARADITIDGVPVPMFEAVRIRPRQVLKIGPATSGLRTYLAIKRGITAPKVFGSCSTFALGKLGGHNGHFFEKPDYETLFNEPWKVHYNSNRIGVRLSGPRPKFARNDGGEAGLHPSNIHDSPYSIGSISFTGDEAVVGTCDGPSLGGFLIFATVITADIWKTGQMKPGDEIKLCAVTIDEAMALDKELRESIEKLSPLPFTVRRSTIVDPVVGSISATFVFHVRYDPSMTQGAIISLLTVIEKSLGPALPESAPSRTISLPLVVEHISTLAAVKRYARTIRPTAPWLPNNIDFLTKFNGLSHRDEISNIVFDATFLVLGLGDVFFGAPCAIPLDPRHRLFGTKYSPPRSFTPDGTVGIGGQYLCIYGMDSPGGYQLIGRTVPIWDRWAAAKGKERMWMFEVFDRICFYPVSEETLDEARESKTIDNLVKIEEGELNLADYEAWIKETSEEAAESRRLRLQTLKESGLVDELKQAYQLDSSHGEGKDEDESLNDKEMIVRADIAGRCWQCTVEEGDMVEAGQELISVESMKMEIRILAPRSGRIVRLLVGIGQTLDVGDGICVLSDRKDGAD
ncbi:related to DUR1,2-urea amidolyase [Phialocephala subalpina]|uniref:Related to DUR1,2-urea amidolyase n=1 Tax=Phialocephala subalpina TaxID=576137 RepID=A0A1L7X353_9HELO|nr:related to DUR1,2-urea amidolyase [Phialocephala subalpina]